MNCFECGLRFGEWDHVACDGCHRFVHRDCTDGYQIIDTEWQEHPLALIFCKECGEE